MTRLIDAEALKAELEAYRHTRNYKSDEDEAQNNLLDNILEDIDNAPTVNPYFPLTEEVFYKITDAEFEHGDSFYIVTPSGKKIEFEKKRPRGEWLKSGKGKTIFFCSECGREIDTKPFTRPDNFPFCNCGSDMRGEEE